MLFKDKLQFNSLVNVFNFKSGDYSLYSLKNSKEHKEVLSSSEEKERIVLVLKGSIAVNGNTLREKDMMYIPIGRSVEINASSPSVTFIAEAKGTKKYDQYVKKYTDATKLQIGQTTFRRIVVTSIGEKDPANRLIGGYVEDSKGEWSSYPPHRHDDKPEAYIFYGIDPGFAVQLVMNGESEQAYVVHDYDTVLIERGYHPHVNTSLTGSAYAWIICAPEDARNMEVMMHPAFNEVVLGKSHLTVK